MTTHTADISNSADQIDVRDIIARVEELEQEISDNESDVENGETDETDMTDEQEELKTLTSLLEDLAGNGGDEQWRGVWYPNGLIRDSYFEDYAQELADDIGAINADARWPNNCIDWERAARELQMDYSSVEYDGVTYWYR